MVYQSLKLQHIWKIESLIFQIKIITLFEKLMIQFSKYVVILMIDKPLKLKITF